MNRKDAEAYCKKQKKRLPTKKEASASWEDMGIQQRSWIWTSTIDKTDSSKVYVLDIISGDIITDVKITNDAYYACCVH